MTAPTLTPTFTGTHPSWCHPRACSGGRTDHVRHSSPPLTYRVADTDITFSIIEDHGSDTGPLIRVETYDLASTWPDDIPIHGQAEFTPAEFEDHCRRGLALVALARDGR